MKQNQYKYKDKGFIACLILNGIEPRKVETTDGVVWFTFENTDEYILPDLEYKYMFGDFEGNLRIYKSVLDTVGTEIYKRSDNYRSIIKPVFYK